MVVSIRFSMRKIWRIRSFMFSYLFVLKLLVMMHLGYSTFTGGRCDVIIWVLMMKIFRSGCYDWICHTKFIKNTKFSPFITFSSYVINILRSFYNSRMPGDVTSQTGTSDENFEKWIRKMDSSWEKCIIYPVSLNQHILFENYKTFNFAIFSTERYPWVKVVLRWRHNRKSLEQIISGIIIAFHLIFS